MLCLKCGNEIENSAKFCPHCGAVTAAGGAFGPGDAPVVPPAPEEPACTAPEGSDYTAPEGRDYTAAGTPGFAAGAAPAPGGKKRRSFAPVIGGAVAAGVGALLVAALIGLFASPKGQVEKAFAKTAAAYADVGERLGLPDLSKSIQDRRLSERMSLRLNSVNGALMGGSGLSSLEGLGMRMSADCDKEGRKLDCELAVFWEDRDVLSFRVLADDETLGFASPQFMGNDAYGFNTETLGADLKRMGADGDLESLGFNLFDLMDTVSLSSRQTEEQAQAADEAARQLLDAAVVVKVGKRDIRVNGSDVSAILYDMTVPQQAMEDYIDALGDAMKQADSRELMRRVLQEIGLKGDVVDELMSEMADEDVYGELIDSMKQALDALGDVELDIYVSGGYVCAVEYEGQVEGSALRFGLYLGGGEHFADDLSLEITVDDETFIIESSGDHSGRSGVFTDETVFRRRSGLSSPALVTSKMNYDPRDGSLQWSVSMSGVSLDMTGRLDLGKDSVELRLDDVAVSAMGSRLVSFGLYCYLGPCGDMPSMPAVRMLAGMSEDELQAWAEGIEANAEAWADDWAEMFQDSLSA